MDKKAENHAEMRMVLAFRGDLDEMTRGKSEVQAAHAAFSAGVRLAIDKPLLVNQYLADGQPKICIEVDDEDHLAKVVERARKRGVHVEIVRDQGRTVFAGPTQTCAIMGPMSKTDSNAITRGTRMRDREKQT
ncbi:aminoacyl-tRNA hydrolase [uncultured Salinicola sp.]|uniref:aminoacyl-tRNA hydrolase n=1 Tax=uncultured Salinicola sp. TaxID=1193542 RepID=UPI0026281E4B|nr:aminoacyl-tRNA hydrolase [uncultured Salinicola sp.]